MICLYNPEQEMVKKSKHAEKKYKRVEHTSRGPDMREMEKEREK